MASDTHDQKPWFADIFSGPSVGAVLDANRGMGPGFDLCRIGLSLGVMLIHSSWLANPYSGQLTGWLHPFVLSVLALFFGLSGFLVTGSAIRLRSLRTFIAFRVLRIMPALMVEVTLSAVVFGSLLTTWNLADYYADPRFYTYFGNIVGWIHFVLPGVFEHNPHPNVVNGNLWTLHPEFICYGIMGALIVFGVVYSRWMMTAVWLAATVAGTVLNLYNGMFELGFHFSGTALTYCFLTGVTAFHWRERIVVNTPLAVAACVLSYILLALPHTVFLAPAPLMYIIIWLGMQKFPRIEFLQRGDYSYGIYLYGFPIQQALILLVPGMAKWWIVFPASTLAALAVAMASWHFIEKPALKLKRFVIAKPKTARPPASAGGDIAGRETVTASPPTA